MSTAGDLKVSFVSPFNIIAVKEKQCDILNLLYTVNKKNVKPTKIRSFVLA